MTESDALQSILNDVVTPSAVEIDATGTFPRKAVDALATAGVLAATVKHEYGGGEESFGAAVEIVRRLAQSCSSTAMVVTMHYAATAVLDATGRTDVLAEIGAGHHLTTLAFSETGSRSHFWAPMSTARVDGDEAVLDARKSWVTSASEASSYVWSSRPVAADGPMTLWTVNAHAPGLTVAGAFDGVGLRGNDSRPVTADGLRVSRSAQLGDDGAGLDIALGSALPWFLLLSAAASVGLMQAVVAEAAAHLTSTKLEHLGASLADQLPARTRLATIQIQTDRTRALVDDAVRALESGRPDATLVVLETKAAADESVALVADLGLSLGGGAAFRKESGFERRFRDSRAGRVMAPTTDALLDFIGRAMTGLPLLDSPAA